MNRALCLLIAALPVIGPGCMPNHFAQTGWEFRMGRPTTFNTPGLVQANPSALGVLPLGSGVPPLVGSFGLPGGPPVVLRGDSASCFSTAPAAPVPDVNLAILEALARLEQRLGTLPPMRTAPLRIPPPCPDERLAPPKTQSGSL